MKIPETFWRSRLAIWALALSPGLWLALFWSLVVRTRLSLGHWPMPSRPDPGEVGFEVHQLLVIVGLGVALAAAPLVVASAVHRRDIGHAPRVAAWWPVVVVALGVSGLVLWAGLDPGQYLEWFLD